MRKHGRLPGVGEQSDGSVGAIGGHDVLAEIVAADAEEIHLGGQLLVTMATDCRHLDHHPHSDMFGEGDTLPPQLGLCLDKCSPGGPQLGQRGRHGEHHC